MEALAQRIREARPGGLEIRVPRHEGFVVVRPEVVKILGDQQPVHGVADLTDGGDLAIGENILFDPWVGDAATFVLADRLKEKNAVIRQTAPDHPHEGPVILLPDMFEHADAGDRVEFSVDLAVVLQAELKPRIGVALPGERGLLF